MSECVVARSIQAAVVEMTESDIPGVLLSEPVACQTVPELRWWLLYQGIRAGTLWKKLQLVAR